MCFIDPIHPEYILLHLIKNFSTSLFSVIILFNVYKKKDINIYKIVTLTCSAVDTESITVGTLARIATRRILADADAEIVVLEFSALVDVAARSIIGIQPEARLASASVAAPNVQTDLLTESRCTLTLVDVL